MLRLYHAAYAEASYANARQVGSRFPSRLNAAVS